MRGRPPKMPTVTPRPSSPRALNAARAAASASSPPPATTPSSARAALLDTETTAPSNALQRQVARLLDQYLASVLSCEGISDVSPPSSPIPTNDDSFRLFTDSKPGNLVVSKKRRAVSVASAAPKRSRVGPIARLSTSVKRKVEHSTFVPNLKSASSSSSVDDDVSSISGSDSEDDPEEMARLQSAVYHVNVGPPVEPTRT